MRSDADKLLEILSILDQARGGILPLESGNSGLDLMVVATRARLALDLRRRGPAFQLRALVEDWDLLRLNRELY